MADVDILVVGGGINGCGIARDAVGRGYSVMLAEKADLASGTSSTSTKLIHGGLRYLEYYEFRLVREALKEREVLWAMAPHIIWPLRFVLPHHKGLRPAWFLRLGLFLYDHLGGRKLLPATRSLDLTRDATGTPLKRDFVRAFEYSDCWVQDSRLVVLNARDAADRGATILTRTRLSEARRVDGGWVATLTDETTGENREVRARLIVNAAGPWVDEVVRRVVRRNDARNVRLVQGSHIVVRKLYDHDRCYIFQNADGRIIFAIPYEQDFTLIGTTDRDYKGDPGAVRISEAESDYLLASASEYFAKPLSRADLVWSYSGVRPLYDDGASKAQEATRDYVLKLEGGRGADGQGEAPLINIFGGKITTYRRLAESVLDLVGEAIGSKGQAWSHSAPLPGGDFPATGFAALVDRLARQYPALPTRLVTRLARDYGTRALVILGAARRMEDLGRLFGSDLTQAEVDYCRTFEWCRSAEDMLWRRTKLGLRLSADESAGLEAYLNG